MAVPAAAGTHQPQPGPVAPTASIARLLSPAKTNRITIAAPASRKLRRASQRCERVPSGLDSGVTAAVGAHAEAT